MSWRTNSAVLRLRSVGRTIGLNRLLGALLATRGYEDRFQTEMINAVRDGDVVWDVGANIGLYSKMLAERVGPAGNVFAFEPSPMNLLRLQDVVASLGNVCVVPVALGAYEGTVVFEQGCDALGATSRVVFADQRKTDAQSEVQLSSGDMLIASGGVSFPNVVKIDTEGSELDVLLGMKDTLQRKELRSLCVEVHFGLLKARGLRSAPADIESILESSGFAVSWVDPSHIIAHRLG